MDEPSATLATRAPPPNAAFPLRGVLLGFSIDVAMAVVIGFALTMFASLIWSVLDGARAAMGGADADAVGSVIAAPGAMAQICIVLLAFASTALLLYAWRRPATATERSHSHAQIRKPRIWGLAVAIAVMVFVGTSLASWALQQVGLAPNPANLAIIREAFAQSPAFVVFFTVLAAPLYEELLFRRVLFGRFWQAGRPRLGMVLSGLVFALSHEVPGMGAGPLGPTICLFLVYALMGAAFAWLYRRTGTLWAPILAHALNNGLALLLLSASVG
ncbi:MAG TPA: CPBP family intramembrane glutamic endopeptidase [Pseudoxanthomonas sp.]|nr:CPBP family intramembrane glutamic endopeptidase [Pseudoxanthomonas sp.]